ncbi:hypothetical protein N0V93_009397 [Gnomoniopsis smithogilvyi]|uniref:C3H1-type domain-containing protein n=1 Tax=Gnomoniopsis smithogilvyi TaxID=1191159 RepID=A0A9W9CSN4_9PEZI|nr:hypothetical protein N0V93_009397 [Gnomoniopsis smithogilvyi]
MSGYPYGYPYQGQPPPPQQYPSYPPYGAFPPLQNGFGATPPQSQQQQPQQQQHYAPPATSYHANAQSAYDYNASSIPGLGTPSGGPPFSAPYNSAWTQGGFGTVAGQVPYPAYASTAPASSTPASTMPITYPYPQAQAPEPQVPSRATPTYASQSRKQSDAAPKPQSKARPAVQSKSQDSNDEAQEEGEIDDGYFDDLYDDASKAASVTNETLPVAEKSSADPGDDSLDQEPNFYDTDMEDVSAMQKPSDPINGEEPEVILKSQGQPDRDRSRSYSPHLSPTENESNIHSNTPTYAQQSSPAEVADSSSKSTPSNANQVKNGATVEAHDPAVTSPVTGSTPVKTFASVFEASNEAKKAILRLLPHGVKYQTYIDEGFDAKLIKDLFTQLNLPTDSTTSGLPEKTATDQDRGVQPTSTQSPQQTQTDSVDKKQEARKDKIARLMAEKKAKLAAASNTTGAAAEPRGVEKPATVTAVSTPPAKTPITRAEKDRLLQQKVEALRNKAREAKKLAQKSAPTQTPKPDTALKPTTPQAPAMTTQLTVAPHSASGTPISSASQSAAPSPVVSVGPSLPRAPQINQRKRPVAADFMDYPPLPVKRPSLANRQNSSLVISISDDEDEDDDDDDVEMEVDSATEDSPAPLPQVLTHTKRGGPSIRDFPPLSNIKTPRQVHSPVNGLSVSGTKNPNVDLETKERAILEMQRKIKELEAKKEAKAKSGNVTPRSPSTGSNVVPEQALQTPARSMANSHQADDKTTPSAQLLQEAEAANIAMPQLAIRNTQPEDEHRGRATSAQVAGKSAKALEKAERLRRMQEEMQRLQAEIDEEESDGEAEEQRNSGEVEATAETGETQSLNVKLATTTPDSGPGAEVTQTETSSASFPEELIQPSLTSPNSQAMQIDFDLSRGRMSAEASPHADSLLSKAAAHTPTVTEESRLPDASDTAEPPHPREQSVNADLDRLDDYEPPEPKMDVRVGANSPRLSPAPAKVDQLATRRAGEGPETSREVFVGSTYPIGTSLTHRKAVNDIAPTRQASFAPYESPLRYYHAYRFHKNYNDGVPGGLKSLTYSNRIDPNKEMCPDEWEGNDCPRGDACQFQHFQSIIAPDSEIILELGSSDEFTGDQKRDFNNGLREVVASFQKSKVRDFRTIAQAILEFRRRFLGDPSKVLRLEGVNI